MDIAQRVQAILLTPKAEWAKIKGEPTTVAEIFRSYVLILAAIPAVFQFLQRVLVEKMPMGRHVPLGRAFLSAAVAYVLDLAVVYVFALIVNELAPTFASGKNRVSALKLVAYSMTPYWLVGVFSIIPRFWAPRIVAGLYGFFLLYLGLEDPLMDTPKKKVFGYLAAAIVAVVVLKFVSWLMWAAFNLRTA